MTKEDKIKEAYGEYWESVKLLTDENGFICQSTLFFPETEMMDKMKIQVKPFPPDGRCYWRPMALKGIENNNGWIKIESEEDLPNGDYALYHVISKNDIYCDKPKNQGIDEFWGNDTGKKEYWLKEFTHYQPIFKPAIPLY